MASAFAVGETDLFSFSVIPRLDRGIHKPQSNVRVDPVVKPRDDKKSAGMAEHIVGETDLGLPLQPYDNGELIK